MIDQATRLTRTTQTLLDVILTSKADLFSCSGAVDLGLSDHHMVYGFLTEKVKCHSAKIITFRSTKSLDMEDFKKDLRDCEGLLNKELASAEEKYSNWSEALHKVMDKHMPIKSMRVRKKDIPFMTTEWKAAIRMKHRSAKKYNKNKT